MLPAERTANELARVAEARLHVVHAADGGAVVGEGRVRQHLREAGYGPEDLNNVRSAPGPADRVITGEAHRVDADVVVLGPHRPDRPSGLGSTAVSVVHAADVPCLILPVPLSLPLTSVLTPVDASAGSSRARYRALDVALTWASALRHRQGMARPTRLVVLYIAPPGAAEAGALESLEQDVAALRDRFGAAARVDIELSVERADDPARAILQRAESEGSDLILLASRGAATEYAARLGSVSAAVLRGTTRPVLLVPPPATPNHDH